MAVALSFCRLLGLGCPKQAFAKIATPRLFFLESETPQEEEIYSLQFRTINNQRPNHSPKLRSFVEQVEKQRHVYLGLLEDLGETVNNNWYPDDLNLNEDTKSISANIREWLGLAVPYDFRDIRDAVEQKGIMVIVSNAYNGKWQIDKKNPVRGFSLYYDVLPIIVIKKQTSSGAQTFTLMHEFAHLLLHRESAIDNDEDFYNYQGKEKEAAGSRYFCESLFWASQPKQAAKT